MTVENIYGIAHGPADNPTFLYVGKTVSDIDTYFRQVHFRNCQNGIEKELYEHWRHLGLDACYIVLLDTTESGLTEADYVRTLTDAGHTLLNSNGGNSRVAAKTSEAKKVFRAVNREATKRLEPAKPTGDGTPFLQTKSWDEAYGEFKDFIDLTVRLARDH